MPPPRTSRAACLALAALAAPGAVADEGRGLRGDGGRDVQVAADDGTRLSAAWWYDPSPGGAAVVLLGADRGAWTPLVRRLRHRGMNVLALEVAKKAAASSALLVVAHADDREGAVALSDAALAGRLLVWDDARRKGAADGWSRGTSMFGRLPLAELAVASFVDVHTGSTKDEVVLDGLVADEARDGGPWSRATVVGRGKDRVWAYRVGRRIVFGGIAPKGTRGLRLDFAGTSSAGPDGSSEWFRRDFVDVRASRAVWMAVIPQIPDDVRARDVPPAVRAVPGPDGISFEGEWTTHAATFSEGGRTVDAVRMLVFFETRVPPPERGDPSGNVAAMPVLPVR